MSPEIISLFEVASPESGSPFRLGEGSSGNGGLKTHPQQVAGAAWGENRRRKEASPRHVLL